MSDTVNIQAAISTLNEATEQTRLAIESITKHDTDSGSHQDIRDKLKTILNNGNLYTEQQAIEVINRILGEHSTKDFKKAHPGWEEWETTNTNHFTEVEERIQTLVNKVNMIIDTYQHEQEQTTLQSLIQAINDKYAEPLSALQESYRQAVADDNEELAHSLQLSITEMRAAQNAEILKVIKEYTESHIDDEEEITPITDTVYINHPASYQGIQGAEVPAQLSLSGGTAIESKTYTLVLTVTDCSMTVNNAIIDSIYSVTDTLANLNTLLESATVNIGFNTGSITVTVGETTSAIAVKVVSESTPDPLVLTYTDSSVSGQNADVVEVHPVITGGDNTSEYTLTITLINCRLVLSGTIYTSNYTTVGTVESLNSLLSRVSVILGTVDGSVSFEVGGTSLTVPVVIEADIPVEVTVNSDIPYYSGSEDAIWENLVTISGGNTRKTYALTVLPTNCVIFVGDKEVDSYTTTDTVEGLNTKLQNVRVKLGEIDGKVSYTVGTTTVEVPTKITKDVIADQPVVADLVPSVYRGENGDMINSNISFSCDDPNRIGTLTITPVNCIISSNKEEYVEDVIFRGTVNAVNDFLTRVAIIVGTESGNVTYNFFSNNITIPVESVAPSESSAEFDDKEETTDIIFTDEGIMTEDGALTDNKEASVHVANDVIYYEDRDTYDDGYNEYGTGEADERHTPEEAEVIDVVHITTPGTYRLSGYREDIQIFVDLGEDRLDETFKVKLILDGVTLKNTIAPAILITNVYNDHGATIEVAANSVNNISGSHVANIYEEGTANTLYYYPGAIHSVNGLYITGTGRLNVDGDKFGICAEGVVNIDEATINVEAPENGIASAEEVIVEGGIINVTGDGIFSDGNITVNNGLVAVTTESAKHPLEAHEITINGGYVVATGGSITNLVNDNKAQNTVVFNFNELIESGTVIVVTDFDNHAETGYSAWANTLLDLRRGFTTMLISTPELSSGGHYAYAVKAINANGTTNPLGIFTEVTLVTEGKQLTHGVANSSRFNLVDTVNTFDKIKVSGVTSSF